MEYIYMFKKVYSYFFKGGYIVCINKGKKFKIE